MTLACRTGLRTRISARRRRRAWVAVPATLALLLAFAQTGAAHRAGERAPRCFGAASRDTAGRPCHNPRLRLSVTPTPRQAVLDPGAPCTKLEPYGQIEPCAFGTAPAKATGRFALIGDSHAAHWRSAFAAMARTQHSRGYALVHNGCPYSTAGRPLPEPYLSECNQFKQEIPEWLARHPQVKTVYLAQLTRNAGEFTGSPDPFAARTQAYVDAWRQLPPSVERVFVVRDTPEIHFDTLACVTRAHARGKPAGRRCAVARKTALARDPAAAAATRLGPPRFQLVDLTRFFCGERRCYPVVGGVLVYKDITHITAAYAETLGPYVLREVRRLSKGA